MLSEIFRRTLDITYCAQCNSFMGVHTVLPTRFAVVRNILIYVLPKHRKAVKYVKYVPKTNIRASGVTRF